MSRMSEMADKLAAKTTSGTKVAILSLVKFLEEIGWKLKHGIILVDLGDRKFTEMISYDLDRDVSRGILRALEREGKVPKKVQWKGDLPPHEVRSVDIKGGYVIFAPHYHRPSTETMQLLPILPDVPGEGRR